MKANLYKELTTRLSGVSTDGLLMKSGNMLPSPYSGKNATKAPQSILFHTFRFSFRNKPRRPMSSPNRNKAAVWNTRPLSQAQARLASCPSQRFTRTVSQNVPPCCTAKVCAHKCPVGTAGVTNAGSQAARMA